MPKTVPEVPEVRDPDEVLLLKIWEKPGNDAKLGRCKTLWGKREQAMHCGITELLCS